MITTQQSELYDQLIRLCRNNEAFYFQDFEYKDTTYRIFNYRLASYSDFLHPGALEARGIMYVVKNEKPIRLASRPMHKFFNLNENPFTMNLDLDEIYDIETKSDGSLISTYIHYNNDKSFELRLKTKGSIYSDQAIAAMDWLEKNVEMKQCLETFACGYFTANLEWTSPDNRIVIGYMEPRLILLNVRDQITGEYYDLKHAKEHIRCYMNEIVSLNGLSPRDFVLSVPDMVDNIEGYVVKMISGLWFKVKTNKYLSLHHCKDSVSSPRRLFEAVVDEAVDDLRSMFYEDTLLIKQIDEMQQKVDHIFNNMVKLVESFWNNNKHLERKDYAIKAQQEVEPKYFSLCMMKYLGKPVDYKTFMKKNYRSFGIKDEDSRSI